jgi:hypothetical protein
MRAYLSKCGPLHLGRSHQRSFIDGNSWSHCQRDGRCREEVELQAVYRTTLMVSMNPVYGFKIPYA